LPQRVALWPRTEACLGTRNQVRRVISKRHEGSAWTRPSPAATGKFAVCGDRRTSALDLHFSRRCEPIEANQTGADIADRMGNLSEAGELRVGVWDRDRD
jgi:hypothetical protein